MEQIVLDNIGDVDYPLDKASRFNPLFIGWLFCPIDGGDMRHVNMDAFYTIGHHVHALLEIPVGKKFNDIRYSLSTVHTFLEGLIEGRYVPLSRCVKAGELLLQVINDLAKVGTLGQQDIDRLHLAVYHFEAQLSHELDDLDVYYIPPKGTHSTLSLIEKADENLPSDVRSRLTPEAVYDVKQAGRCLALDAPTAAGFHILRAVESLIRIYVDKVTGKPHPSKNRNWGAYINAIRNNNGDTRVANFLQHVKDTYRNPIMHPEVVLTSDEAFSLFNASLSAIVQLDTAIQAWP